MPVTVKNPDEEILSQDVVGIAQALSAKVQGDDSEVYDLIRNGQLTRTSSSKKPWWRFW